MAIRIDLPTTVERIRSLEVGDEVRLFGRIVTARDMAHKFMVEKRPDWLRPMLDGTIIYHCGPVMKKTGRTWSAVAAGPTTSAREEPYQGPLMEQYGIRAVIGKGQYSDPRASEALLEILMTRREKVLGRWLTGVNPLVDFALGADGRLRFANAAVQAGVTTPASEYQVEWLSFDNESGESTPAGQDTATAPTASAPASLLSNTTLNFVEARVSAAHADHPSWAEPVVVHFRRVSGGWELVGLRRQPD